MKPYEETWCANRYVIELGEHEGAGRPIGQFIDDGDDDDPMCDRNRAMLAAQAPAMARLLLAMQKVTFVAGYENVGGCPSCGWGSGWSSDPIEHSPDCEIVAVLKAAGIVAG